MSRFETGEIYHIYNRGVEKRDIFLDESDYNRFLFILDVFNDKNSTLNITRRISLTERNAISLKPVSKERLVKIREFCLMPNHFHLLVEQIENKGISEFMRRIGIGYTHHFNNKYKRSGVLFQGRTKSKHINSNPYLMWIKRYIHLNPVDVLAPQIKKGSIKNIGKTIEKLNNYKWVSCDNFSIYTDDLKSDLEEILQPHPKDKN
jgi:putative transposase